MQTPDGVSRLAIGYLGTVQQFVTLSQVEQGIEQPGQYPAPLASTDGILNAYWDSGYWGNDDPDRWKLFRRLRINADQQGFNFTAQFVDEITSTFSQPEQATLGTTASQLAINKKTKRMSLGIQFPPQDVNASVLELEVAAIPLSER